MRFGFFGVALVAVALALPGAPAFAEEETSPDEVLYLERTQCLKLFDASPMGKASLLCCLAQLDMKYGSRTDLTVTERAAVGAVEADAIARLAALGSPDRPRVCPARPPTSTPFFFLLWSQPEPEELRIGGGGNRPRGVPLPGPGGSFGSLPSAALSFGLGTLLAETNTDLPVGPGLAQRFPANPFSSPGVDFRLSWLLARALTNEDPRLEPAARTVITLFAGYSYLRGRITEFTNVGGIFDGVTNTAFRGHSTTHRPYVGLAMAVPLNEGAAVGSIPPLSLHLAGTLGYSWIRISDDNSAFEDTQDGVDAGVEVGLNVGLNERWTVTPAISAVFGGHRADPELMFTLRSTLRF